MCYVPCYVLHPSVASAFRRKNSTVPPLCSFRLQAEELHAAGNRGTSAAMPNDMAHPYPRHLSNFSYVGKYLYSLIFCTAHGTFPFEVAAHVRLVLGQFLRAARENGFELTAYCFMPDHVHLLVSGLTDASDCRSFIKAMEQYAGYYFKQSTGMVLWQRYGYEHVLRSEVERANDDPLHPRQSTACAAGHTSGGLSPPRVRPLHAR